LAGEEVMRDNLISTIMWVILLFLVIHVLGCQTNVPKEVVVQPTPVVGPLKLAWDGKHKDSKLWDAAIKEMVVLKQMGKKVPEDMGTFCPSYGKLSESQRDVVWMQLMSIMAKYESGFNPKTYFMEPAPLNYESIGLFQLSYEDANNYPECKLRRSEKNLVDGVTNINCAAIIMNKLVTRDNRVAGIKPGSWKGGARYWAVLRYDKKGKPRPSYNSIVAYIKALPECK
jgi:hypothetical protein